MSRAILDELAPLYVGAKTLALALQDSGQDLLAFTPTPITVDYSDTEPQGVYLPMELLVVGPSVSDFRRVVYYRLRPGVILWTPQSAGLHRLTLREVGHNQWWGTIALTILGA